MMPKPAARPGELRGIAPEGRGFQPGFWPNGMPEPPRLPLWRAIPWPRRGWWTCGKLPVR